MAAEDTDHNIIRQCAEQDVKLKYMERSTMKMLAAIPEEYDGSKYQQNLHQLKKDLIHFYLKRVGLNKYVQIEGLAL